MARMANVGTSAPRNSIRILNFIWNSCWLKSQTLEFTSCGRYEIQILDSHGWDKWTFNSLGGLYQRWPASRGEGVAP